MFDDDDNGSHLIQDQNNVFNDDLDDGEEEIVLCAVYYNILRQMPRDNGINFVGLAFMT